LQAVTEKTQGRLVTLEGSYLTPSIQHARVADAMRTGVITCPPDTSLKVVAKIMATNHVHAVVVSGLPDGAPWGAVTDQDLLAVASDASDHLAGHYATATPVMVKPGERLEDAAQLMCRRGVTHLLVGDPESERPIGVLSSLDIAGIVAWGRG
jgi:CBS domain-containing protein